mmetsp:Transcript_25078/g.57961  ORF Transcript_25078/g.57961 Transcript_25078/m.57961 type:complete len:321 (+) Transcript_25078:417-1379(+)
MVSPFHSDKFSVFGRNITFLQKVFGTFYRNPVVVGSVVHNKRNGQSRNHISSHRLHCVQQSHGCAKAERIPTVSQTTRLLFVSVIGPGLRFLPYAFRRNGMGHEKWGPPGEKRREKIPKEKDHGRRRKISHDSGTNKNNPREPSGTLLRPILKISAGMQGQASAVALSHEKHRRAFAVFRRHETQKLHQVVAIGGPVGDEKTISLAVSVAEHVEGVEGDANGVEGPRVQCQTRVPAVCFLHAISALSLYPVCKNDYRPWFYRRFGLFVLRQILAKVQFLFLICTLKKTVLGIVEYFIKLLHFFFGRKHILRNLKINTGTP